MRMIFGFVRDVLDWANYSETGIAAAIAVIALLTQHLETNKAQSSLAYTPVLLFFQFAMSLYTSRLALFQVVRVVPMSFQVFKGINIYLGVLGMLMGGFRL